MHMQQHTLIITFIVQLLPSMWDIGLPQIAGYHRSLYGKFLNLPGRDKGIQR